MILSTLTTDERERLAYIEGYTEAAALLARLDDMHHALAQAVLDYDTMRAEYDASQARLAALGDV